jgi:hypothetical protein
MRSPSKVFLLSACFVFLGFSRIATALTGSGQPGYYGGQTITCSSDDGKRNYCNVDTRGGVRLTRQISGSPCVEGQTWGYDNRGVWVDRGCRAEFVSGGGGNWTPGGPGYGPGNQYRTVTCSSDDGKRNYCDIDTRRGVRLTRQISGTPCVEGHTWGYDNRGVWVDRGCRAEFVSGGGGNWTPGGPGNQYQTVSCSSDNGKRNYCSLPYNVNPNNVVMTRQISGSPCTRGDTWGVDNRGLWVDRGCRAEFSIR